MKKIIAIVLSLLCVFGCTSTALAAEEASYYPYESYMLLGDSSVSGFLDGTPYTGTFERVDGSFSAIVADTLGIAPDKFYPRACRGFRTVEYRYIFEDDYVADEWLFGHTDKAQAEQMKYQIREEIKNVDLITMGVGGNDFGAYIGWVMDDIMAKEGATDELVAAVREFLASKENDGNDTINKLLEVAQAAGHLEEMVQILPNAMYYTISTYINNWNHLIEDIYSYNPDVHLVVLGIYSSAIQSEEDKELQDASVEIQDLVVDLANKPMTDGAKKYGYTFVETTGIVTYLSHATWEGHKELAQKVLAALPKTDFPFSDVDYVTTYYQAVRYMYDNGLMQGISATEFGVNEAMTQADFSAVLNKLDSANAVSDSDKKLTYGKMASSLFGLCMKKGSITGFIKSFAILFDILSACNFNITEQVNKATAAEYIYDYVMA